MSVSEKVLHHLQVMPESAQAEVLHFIESLESKIKTSEREAEADWFSLSLSSAMHGMEDEQTPYAISDIKDSFS